MKCNLFLLLYFALTACNHSASTPDESNNNQAAQRTPVRECNYNMNFAELGNRKIDTFRINQKIVDPIDDITNFRKAAFNFVQKDEKVYKKAKTHRFCEGKFIDVEYYQDFSGRIDLDTYKEFDETYFTTNGKVFFWWVNSDGHLMLPINDADPKTFQPFENICGGRDDKKVYYGCPNLGVYQLDIPINSKFEFIAKENNYWNSPKHYVIVDDHVFDVKYEWKKGYYCELAKSVSVADIRKIED